MFKKYFKIYFIIAVAVAITIYGIITVNIYNTKALSPKGDEDKYEIINKEFGAEFSDFIKDKAQVKIYLGQANDGESTVKFIDKKLNLTMDNVFVNYFKSAYIISKNTVMNIIDKFSKENTDNSNNKIEKENNKNNTNVEDIIDDFIKTQTNE